MSSACPSGYRRPHRVALQRRCVASLRHRKGERRDSLPSYATMRISAVSPLPATNSAEYLGGLPRGQGLSPRFSIHFPISADLNSGQVVQKVRLSRQRGCTPWPGSTTCTWRSTPFKGRNTRRLDSASTRNPEVAPCQPLRVISWPFPILSLQLLRYSPAIVSHISQNRTSTRLRPKPLPVAEVYRLSA